MQASNCGCYLTTILICNLFFVICDFKKTGCSKSELNFLLSKILFFIQRLPKQIFQLGKSFARDGGNKNIRHIGQFFSQ